MNTCNATDSVSVLLGGEATWLERWVIAHTKSRQEKSLVSDLIRSGVMAYFPTIREQRTHGQRKRWVDLPLFAGYVFVRGGAEIGSTILRTGRVAGVIEVSDQATLIHELRQIEAAIACGAKFSTSPYLERGTPARVTRGSLRGIEGVIESVSAPSRLVLVVQTLGQATSIELSPGDVEAIL